MALKLKLTRKPSQQAELSVALPPRVHGRIPYGAYHTPGRPDNEWEVRDCDGILVRQVVGADFEVAKRRSEWLAAQLNKAYQKGTESRKGER